MPVTKSQRAPGNSQRKKSFEPPRLPAEQSPLDKPVQFLRGVGPHRAKLLAGMGIQTVGDLIEYFPFRHQVQPNPQPIETLMLDEPATIIGVVESVRIRGRFRNSTVNVRLNDGTGSAHAKWFNSSYLRDRLERGQVLRLFGRVGEYNSLAQLVNPSIEWLDSEADPTTWNYAKMIPIYRVTNGLTSPQIAQLVDTALEETLSAVGETLPTSLCRQRQFPSRTEAIEKMHHPSSLDELTPARQRLAYEEFYMMQLAIALQRRWRTVHAQGPSMPTTEAIDRRIRERFPFTLTDAQDRAVAEIAADLARTRPMTRLLQGDVGSGKTVVALYAALAAIANRNQCVILAPTEVLAAQHFTGFDHYLTGSRVKRCLLTGKSTKSHREATLRAIANGNMNLIVGTHALLEQKVRFASLGLVIVDEQHKFGVSQRAALRSKNKTNGRSSKSFVPHYLVMTATPIPRTLSMTVFGDLDVSIIDQLPPGRQPISTRVVRPKEEGNAWLTVRQRIAQGDQVYIVYPLIDESDALELKAATVEVDRVARELLPGARVGLLHGRLKKDGKQEVMRAFVRGDIDVLVSTTVIEVGVDVSNATVMVIQHAERYGLSALHQLRGRVGRGSKPSLCMLMTDSSGSVANERLGILCKTTDGFRIAEEDLRIRGPGELLGTRQHGWPEFRVANLIEDVDLLMQARDDAAKVVRDDPRLQKTAHAALKTELRRRFREKIAFIDVG